MSTKKTQNTIINFLWRFAERCAAQFVTLIVSIVLARILTPSDFGMVVYVFRERIFLCECVSGLCSF